MSAAGRAERGRQADLQIKEMAQSLRGSWENLINRACNVLGGKSLFSTRGACRGQKHVSKGETPAHVDDPTVDEVIAEVRERTDDPV